MKIEIINKLMLCWDENEDLAEECHVLAKVCGGTDLYPFKVVSYNGSSNYFIHAKDLPESIEMTSAEASKALGEILNKDVKIVG